MTDDKFCFWSEHARTLQGTVGDKIKAIIEQDAIIYDQANKEFHVKPIMRPNGKPYNSTTHIMKNHRAFGFSCSCQGWQMKLKRHEADPINQSAPFCSHVCALYEFLKRRNTAIRSEKVQSAMTMFMEG